MSGMGRFAFCLNRTIRSSTTRLLGHTCSHPHNSVSPIRPVIGSAFRYLIASRTSPSSLEHTKYNFVSFLTQKESFTQGDGRQKYQESVVFIAPKLVLRHTQFIQLSNGIYATHSRIYMTTLETTCAVHS